MDAPVLDQSLQRDAGGLTTYRVECGEHDSLGGVVDDDVDPGDLLEGTDIPPLAADNPALHVVGRKLDHGHSRLGGQISRHTLNGQRDNLASFLLGLLVRLLLDLSQTVGRVCPRCVLEIGDKLGLCVVPAQTGQLLEPVTGFTLARGDALGVPLQFRLARR